MKQFKILMLVFALLFVCGCQRANTILENTETKPNEEHSNLGTPNIEKPNNFGETDIIKNELYEILQIPHNYSTPQIVAPSNMLTINVNANVEVPNDSLLTANIRKTSFSSAQIETYSNMLFGSAKRVENDAAYTTPTKGYLQRKIDDLEAALKSWDLQSQFLYSNYANEEDAQQALRDLKQQIEGAPTSLPAANEKYILTNNNYTSFAMPDDNTFSEIIVWEPLSKNSELNYLRDYYLIISAYTGHDDNVGGQIKISEGDALAIAERLLRDLSLNDFTCSNTSTTLYNYDTKAAYVFCFTRQVFGMMETYTNATSYISFWPTKEDILNEKSPSDVKSWGYEKIHVLVDDDGLLFFSYANPCELIDYTLIDNTSLIPFSQIVDIFEENIIKIDKTGLTSNSFSQDLYITNITLGFMSLPNEDYETAQLAPVWDFMGYRKINGETLGSNQRECFFSINALTGSILKRDFEYAVLK